MQALFAMSVAGLAVSFCAHIDTLFGFDPGSQFRGFWIFQLMLLILFVPMITELFRGGEPANILRSPPWMRVVLYALVVYYGVNFYVFLYWSSSHLSSVVTWRMFSSGWLLLFFLAAVYYRVRYCELK
jgi:hypothetical protein